MDIYGNLRFLTAGNGEFQNFVPERVSSDPVTDLVEGRVIYRTDTNTLKYYDGTTWQVIGTLDTDELDSLEAALGSFIAADGTFVSSAFDTFDNVGGSPLTLYDVLSDFDSAISALAPVNPAEPTNQVVYGTGTGIDSEADFTWNPTTNILAIGSTGTPGSLRAPDNAGAGVNLRVQAGDSTAGGGTGGTMVVQGGTGITTGDGGGLTMIGGTSGAGATGNGGNLIVAGGNSAATNGNGGTASVAGGGATGSGAGGPITINGGTGGASGVGGATTIRGGTGGSSAGNGGNLTLAGGTVTSGTAGSVLIQTAGATRITFEPDGSWNIGGSNGSSGEVLTSNGAGVAPTWQANSASVSEPANQIVYGTGSGVDSEADLQWDPATNVLSVGSQATPATIQGPTTTGGSALTIHAGDASGVGSSGGGLTIRAGENAVDGSGGSLNVAGGNGTGATRAGGSLTMSGGFGPNVGGSVTVAGGIATTTSAGSTTVRGGNSSGAASGGNLTLASGTSASGTAGSIIVQTGTTSLSTRITFEPDGSWNIGGSNGTTGQVLTSNGAGAAPTWQAVGGGSGNSFGVVSGDVGSPVTADTFGDLLRILGGAGISTAVSGSPAALVITNNDPGSAQFIFKSVSADTGTTVANTNNDTLTLAGGVGITTSVVGSPAGLVNIALDATLDDLTDVVIASKEIGQVVVVSGSGSPQGPSNFVNRHIYAESGLRAANTTHPFSHNLGQQFVVVTVLDNANNVVIPNSVTMTDANTVTVTFGSSVECRIIAMGVPSFS